MINNITCQELLDLRENYQFEVKSAQGRNGNGEVPKDVWESAMCIKKQVIEIALMLHRHKYLTLRMQPNMLKVQPQALTVQVNCVKSHEGWEINNLSYNICLFILQHLKQTLQHLPIELTTFDEKLVQI